MALHGVAQSSIPSTVWTAYAPCYVREIVMLIGVGVGVGIAISSCISIGLRHAFSDIIHTHTAEHCAACHNMAARTMYDVT